MCSSVKLCAFNYLFKKNHCYKNFKCKGTAVLLLLSRNHVKNYPYSWNKVSFWRVSRWGLGGRRLFYFFVAKTSSLWEKSGMKVSLTSQLNGHACNHIQIIHGIKLASAGQLKAAPSIEQPMFACPTTRTSFVFRFFLI